MHTQMPRPMHCEKQLYQIFQNFVINAAEQLKAGIKIQIIQEKCQRVIYETDEKMQVTLKIQWEQSQILKIKALEELEKMRQETQCNTIHSCQDLKLVCTCKANSKTYHILF